MRLRAAREALTGVLLPNNRKAAEFAPYLDRLALIALEFPKFKDGRAYSQARQLVETFRFLTRELRAPSARCCATSSCSWCGPASMPSR